jgi:hypothetical protein
MIIAIRPILGVFGVGNKAPYIKPEVKQEKKKELNNPDFNKTLELEMLKKEVKHLCQQDIDALFAKYAH